MRRLLLALVVLLVTSNAHAAYWQGQTYSTALEPAVTTCDLTTGSCTGQDAGTGLFTAATCNGVADDRNAIVSANTFVRGTTTNTNGQLIELYIPPGKTCMFNSGFVSNNLVLSGIKRSRLSFYGSSLKSPSGNGWDLGPAPSGGAFCQKGLNEATGCSARINTVSAGATSVFINTNSYSGSLSSLCARYTVGQWAAVTGFDLQGGYNSPYGFPPNPHFFDFVQITSKANCTTTGEISFSTPLRYDYLSTWPQWNSGSATQADQGGPATIYAMGPWWGYEATVLGGTLDMTCNQCATKTPGRLVTFKDITYTGSFCVWPSENKDITLDNFNGPSCNMELDKIVERVTFKNSPNLGGFHVQSSSVDDIIVDNVTIGSAIFGNGKRLTITNSTIPNLQPGSSAYGVATSASCTNCVITQPILGSSPTYKGGPGDPGTNILYSVSSGVFSIPLGVDVTNLTDNGSGKVRLTVGTTAGWVTGTRPGRNSIFSACSAPSPCTNPAVLITVVDGTTIDLTDYNFADVTWSGAGFLYWDAQVASWAVPGTNFSMTGAFGPGKPFYQVNSVTTSGNFLNIATTVPSGYPTVPLSSGKSYLATQAMTWTCSGCSGNAQAVDFAGAPPNIPMFSYSKRSYTNTTALVNSPLWGKVTSIKINVTQAYTGATNPMRFNPSSVTVLPSGSSSNWNVNINLRQAGLRTITPAGVTCDTGGGPVAGGCSGDGTLTLPDPDTFFVSTLNLVKPDGSPTDQPWAMEYEFIMDQGVVP